MWSPEESAPIQCDAAMGFLLAQQPFGEVIAFPHVAMGGQELSGQCTGTKRPFMETQEPAADIEALIARVPRPLVHRSPYGGCGSGLSLVEAVGQKNIDAMHEALARDATQLDAHCNGRRALHEAIRSCVTIGDIGHQMAQVLLHHGSRPDPLVGDVEGPLHAAVKRGCSAAVQLLLAAGADSNTLDETGLTPLHALCRRMPFQSHIEEVQVVLKLLLQYDANPSNLDLSGKPASYWTPDAGLHESLSFGERLYFKRAFAQAGGKCHWMLPEVAELIVSCA